MGATSIDSEPDYGLEQEWPRDYTPYDEDDNVVETLDEDFEEDEDEDDEDEDDDDEDEDD